ncbi:MAG: hypothetical protein SF029_06090 [bacterium]|nr:hypothetical protein [bacterium]
MKRLLFVILLLMLLGGSVYAQDSAGGITVDASESLGTISPYVFGSNLGQNAIIPLSLMPQAQALNLNYVRLGGGDSDRIDLQLRLIDVFVYQAREIGAEPAITVRLYGGTPEAAAEAVRYANIEKDYNIRYWSIGNEPNIFTSTLGLDSYTTEDLNRDWRTIAEAMLEVDPDILLVGPDVTQTIPLSIDGDSIEWLEGSQGGSPRDANGSEWLVEFLRANGDLLDVVSIHRYPYPGGDPIGTATLEGLRAQLPEWDTSIPNLKQLIRDTTGRDIPLAITEFNSNSSPDCGGEASLDSFYNALWVGDVLGRLIEQQVEIATMWDMQGVGTRCFGLLTSSGVRPVYYTYLMYTHFGTELLAADSANPDVSAYAALREDGTLTLLAINWSSDAVTETLTLSGFTLGGDADVYRFDATVNAELVGTEAISDDGTVTLPPESMTVFVVPAG